MWELLKKFLANFQLISRKIEVNFYIPNLSLWKLRMKSGYLRLFRVFAETQKVYFMRIFSKFEKILRNYLKNFRKFSHKKM